MREQLFSSAAMSAQAPGAISPGLRNAPRELPAAPSWPLWRYLLLLFVLTVGMRAWQLWNTEVTSRDSLTYIRMAWQLEHGNWLEVLPNSSHHPAFPVSAMLMSWAVQPFVGDNLIVRMQLGVQLASILASLLLIIPMFFLGLELFDRRISFWAALLFQCLPAAGRVLGDGLSEAMFLFWAACSLWAVTRSLRTGSLLGFVLCGLTGGLAYLTRPEGLALVVAAVLVLLGRQLLPQGRRIWRQWLLQSGGVLASALLVAVPYMLVIGGLTPKTNIKFVVMNHPVTSKKTEDREQRTEDRRQKCSLPVLCPLSSVLCSLSSSEPLTATPLAVWWKGDESSFWVRQGRGLLIVCQMLARALFWFLWLPALIGVWYHRSQAWRIPGVWVMLVVSALILVALYRITVLMGYLSDRHMLLMVMCLSYWTIAGLDRMGQWTAQVLCLLRSEADKVLAYTPVCSLALLVGSAAVPAYKSLETLHSNRTGFRDAGNWLARNIPQEDRLVDPFGWAYYYAGRIFCEHIPGGAPDDPIPPCYVVIEETDNKHPHLVTWPKAVNAVKEHRSEKLHTWKVPRGQLVVYHIFESAAIPQR